MPLKLLEQSSSLAVSLEDTKNYLRLSHALDNHFLVRMITLATHWIEEATGKTLLLKKWAYTNENNILFLPHPPIREILEVRSKRRIFDRDEYVVQDYRWTKKVETPFYWGKRTLTVTYTAGFGETPEEIPPALTQAVLSTVAYLYENRGVPQEKQVPFPHVQPWIQYYRTFELG